MHHAVDRDELDRGLERAAEILQSAQRLAVLTGAGVSAESGIQTFRGAGGLWEGHSVEDVATPYAFERDPALVWRFYNERRARLREIQPNPGHYSLVRLEDRFGSDRFTLVTQNVDGLHRLAGSRNLLELHGNLGRVRCTRCSVVEDRSGDRLDGPPSCPACGHLLRPDIVWFYEPLPELIWRDADEAARRCDCFLVVGTSAVVYPAAGLIDTARLGGARVIEINLTSTAASTACNVSLFGPSGQILPQLEALL